MKKIVVVTGASKGIGLGIVDALTRVDNDWAKDITTVSIYRTMSDDLALYYGFQIDHERLIKVNDLSNESDVMLAVEKILKIGTPWCLINAAGSTVNAMSWKMSTQQYDKVINDNFKSMFLMCKHIVPWMRLHNAGRIINISSVVSDIGVPGASVYAATKAAVEAYTRTLALEVANKRVYANTISLGYFNTGIIRNVPEELVEDVKQRVPMKRLGNTGDLIPVIKMLMDDTTYITGQTIKVNGGLSL